RELGQVLRIRSACVMGEPFAQAAGGSARKRDFGMIGRSDVSPHFAFEQSQTPIVPPRPEPDRVSHKMISPINPVTVYFLSLFPTLWEMVGLFGTRRGTVRVS